MASEKHPQASSLLRIDRVVYWPTGPDFWPSWNLQHSDSGLEVLEAEQDSLHLCLLRLNFWLQDLEQGLGSWTLAHNRLVQLQVGRGKPGYGGVGRALGMGVSFLG